MTLEVRDGRPVVVRRGSEAVRREAAVLQAIAGPGAPEVLAFDDAEPATLVTTVLPPLRTHGLSPAERASVVADVAAVLARAHAAGLVHGPLRPEHLLGRPGLVLVAGWSDAFPGNPADDVAEVGRLLERLADGDPHLAATAARAQAAGRPTMAALAELLRPNRPGAGGEPARSTSRGRPPLAVVGLAAAGAIGMLLLTGGRGAPAPAPAPAAPPTTMQLGNEVERDGHRWRVGEPGDVVVAGDLGCNGVDAPAILRPRTGQVWVFASWSAGTGRLVATVPGAGAAGIRHAGTCDRLEVRDRQGRWRTIG